jgi:RNA polymerase sigma-70 factor (ECF subfamily)
LASAEDALSEALVAALRTWPRDGVPQNPEAWLLTTARHSFIDLLRHQRTAVASEPTLLLLRQEPKETTLSPTFPDERLKLLFVCAHPAIDPAMHTPLMLQTVLGLDAAPARLPGFAETMGQRLVRAKTEIHGYSVRVPQDRELPQRLDAVLEAFTPRSDQLGRYGGRRPAAGPAEEAIWLHECFCSSPEEAGVRGGWLLMLHCEDATGRGLLVVIPLLTGHETGRVFNKKQSGISYRRSGRCSSRFQLEGDSIRTC